MAKYCISQIKNDIEQLMLELSEADRGELFVSSETNMYIDDFGNLIARKYILNSEYFSDAGRDEIKNHIESYNGGDYTLEVFRWYDGLYINVTLIGVTDDEINFDKLSYD